MSSEARATKPEGADNSSVMARESLWACRQGPGGVSSARKLAASGRVVWVPEIGSWGTVPSGALTVAGLNRRPRRG